ncbi:hypothetical protein EJ08DRAFT_732312 [Tothia fuscella]|uniref:Uncharacterized protein n=1 Tax=Tothia fuscella TaxID=1048955 RepID=A0A9P4TZI8_9PEZI|nr:hypothetical protein EJ08DRAFT_732312 [Tothia fuscella]
MAQQNGTHAPTVTTAAKNTATVPPIVDRRPHPETFLEMIIFRDNVTFINIAPIHQVYGTMHVNGSLTVRGTLIVDGHATFARTINFAQPFLVPYATNSSQPLITMPPTRPPRYFDGPVKFQDSVRFREGVVLEAPNGVVVIEGNLHIRGHLHVDGTAHFHDFANLVRGATFGDGWRIWNPNANGHR